MNLTQEQMERLNSGVEQAREKNIKESLILVDNMSFIVNVKNNTVVTALNGEDEQNVFTNIDGAVIS
jgi:flagellar operon protein